MIALALVRHAKSDWGTGLADHDRPLNERGRRDAPAMAERLAATDFRPQAILSSTAVRAATTAAFFSGAFDVPVELQDELYGAPAPVLLRAAALSGRQHVMVVAHDPGMTVLAERLSGGGIGHMPTCAVAVFAWDTDEWDVATAIDPQSWTFASPRD